MLRYGIGNIRDERLNRAFQAQKVKFHTPPDYDTWFNIMVIHQNRYIIIFLASHSTLQENQKSVDQDFCLFGSCRYKGAMGGIPNKNCIQESMIPSFFDVQLLVTLSSEHFSGKLFHTALTDASTFQSLLSTFFRDYFQEFGRFPTPSAAPRLDYSSPARLPGVRKRPALETIEQDSISWYSFGRIEYKELFCCSQPSELNLARRSYLQRSIEPINRNRDVEGTDLDQKCWQGAKRKSLLHMVPRPTQVCPSPAPKNTNSFVASCLSRL